MKNTLKLDHENGLIVMDRTFAKKAENTMSTEYAHLQNVRRDYPTYQVIRREIKKNPNTEHYKGLTYQYMRDYIILHTSPEKEAEAVAEFDEQLLISRCHSTGFDLCQRRTFVKVLCNVGIKDIAVVLCHFQRGVTQ